MMSESNYLEDQKNGGKLFVESFAGGNGKLALKLLKREGGGKGRSIRKEAGGKGKEVDFSVND